MTDPSRFPWRGSLTGRIVAVCLLLGALESLQQAAGYAIRDISISLPDLFINTYLPWLLFVPFVPLIIRLAGRWPLSSERWLPYALLHAGATLALVLVHELAEAAFISRFSPSPIAVIAMWTKLATFRFAVDALVYWGIVGTVHTAQVSARAREQEQAAARLEASLAEARLSALREQLHPHFLFNSLNAISTLALRGEPEQVTRGLNTLSDLLRFALETHRAQEVPLAEELAFLDRYLELQQMRYGDRLTVVRDIDESLLDAAVPVMLTQPLVENAVRHGIAQEPGPGRLEIRVARASDALMIEVRDSGPGFGRDGDRSEGIGLANTRARLAGLYGERQRLECGDAPGGGARVTVVLPYRPMEVPTPLPAGSA